MELFENLPEFMLVNGCHKARNKRIIEFCKLYIKETKGKGQYVHFAKLLLDIAKAYEVNRLLPFSKGKIKGSFYEIKMKD